MNNWLLTGTPPHTTHITTHHHLWCNPIRMENKWLLTGTPPHTTRITTHHHLWCNPIRMENKWLLTGTRVQQRTFNSELARKSHNTHTGQSTWGDCLLHPPLNLRIGVPPLQHVEVLDHAVQDTHTHIYIYIHTYTHTHTYCIYI